MMRRRISKKSNTTYTMYHHVHKEMELNLKELRVILVQVVVLTTSYSLWDIAA